MFVEKSLTHKGSLQGFTMVELLMVITTVGIISIVALPKFLDFRKEARVATSQNYINHLRSALTTKKTQMMLYCRQGSEVWPRKEAIELNDITEAGAPEAHCSPAQVPNGEDRKFFAQSNIVAATNPYNLRNDIQYTTCTDFCTCEDAGGYLYNQQTGVIGHPLIMNECTGRLPAGLLAQMSGGASGGASSSDSSGGGSSSSEISGGGGESSDSSSSCATSYAMNEEFNLCEDVGCGGFVALDLCGGGGGSVCENQSACNGGTWNNETCTCECSAGGWDYAAYDGQNCIGCWHWQSFNGTYCEDTGRAECEAAGGTFDGSNGQCNGISSCAANVSYSWYETCSSCRRVTDTSGCGGGTISYDFVDPSECTNNIGSCPFESSSSEESSSCGENFEYFNLSGDGSQCIRTYGAAYCASLDEYVDCSYCGGCSYSSESSSSDSSSGPCGMGETHMTCDGGMSYFCTYDPGNACPASSESSSSSDSTIYGCMNPSASNYYASATSDDGSCIFESSSSESSCGPGYYGWADGAYYSACTCVYWEPCMGSTPVGSYECENSLGSCPY